MPWGELTAMLTAIFWTATAMAFEVASKRVGSLRVNTLRLPMAFIYFFIFCWIYRGHPLPIDAPLHAWIWLILSGLIGFVFGDYFLFKSFTIMGSRTTMLVQTLVPPITALVGFILLSEKLSLKHIAGMTLTLCRIFLVVLTTNNGKLGLKIPRRGLLYAIFAALGQSIGLVLSKFGMRDYDAFASSQIRVMAGALGFPILSFALHQSNSLKKTFHDKVAMKSILIGSIFGPFLGVSFSLIAIQHTKTGIASTLMALTPVMILLPSAILFHQKIVWKEIVGAIISVSGASLFFL